MNRQQYVEASSLNGQPDTAQSRIHRESIHHEYYLQFRNPELDSLVLKTFKLAELKAAYTSDPNLNNLPLKQWDNLMYMFERLVDMGKIRELGEGMSRSTCVCTCKTIAVALIEASDRE
jgi:hypothetical protein